jgi:hypothetical protein
MSVSECYFPAGKQHQWKAVHWVQMTAAEFQCPDPFRRMVVTWDGRHTMPCCQGFTLTIDGGPVLADGRAPALSLHQAWASPNFERLRRAHRERSWDDPRRGEPICRHCAVTKRPERLDSKEDS